MVFKVPGRFIEQALGTVRTVRCVRQFWTAPKSGYLGLIFGYRTSLNPYSIDNIWFSSNWRYESSKSRDSGFGTYSEQFTELAFPKPLFQCSSKFCFPCSLKKVRWNIFAQKNLVSVRNKCSLNNKCSFRRVLKCQRSLWNRPII